MKCLKVFVIVGKMFFLFKVRTSYVNELKKILQTAKRLQVKKVVCN